MIALEQRGGVDGEAREGEQVAMRTDLSVRRGGGPGYIADDTLLVAPLVFLPLEVEPEVRAEVNR